MGTYIIPILILLGTVLSGCSHDSPTQHAPQRKAYVVETIDGKSIDDFKKVMTIYPIAVDIDYEDYSAGLPLHGEVKYSEIGWLTIDDGYPGWYNFMTSLPVRRQNLHYFYFSDLEITQDSLVGKYSGGAPNTDSVKFSFTAKLGFVDE